MLLWCGFLVGFLGAVLFWDVLGVFWGVLWCTLDWSPGVLGFPGCFWVVLRGVSPAMPRGLGLVYTPTQVLISHNVGPWPRGPVNSLLLWP